MRKGFSLVELMVVIAIIAVLSTIALFGVTKAQASARDVERQQIMNGVRTALEKYYTDHQAYPSVALNFGDLMNSSDGALKDYLSAPVDPSTTCTTAIPNSASVWKPCGTAASDPPVPVYAYETPDGTHCTTGTAGQVYQLRLDKESGGSSYFCSPK